eukprot:757432-Ditylum_brightwellii.AAC.1
MLIHAGKIEQLGHQLTFYQKKATDSMTEAARIATRMLVGDEYNLSDAYIAATDIWIKYTNYELSEECLE